MSALLSSLESCLLSPASAQYWMAEAMTDISGLNVVACLELMKIVAEAANRKYSIKERTVLRSSNFTYQEGCRLLEYKPILASFEIL